MTDRHEDDLGLLVEVAREAGEIAHRYFGGSPETWYKGREKSPVSEADMAVDRHVRERLTARRPAYGWLSEESIDDKRRLDCHRVFVVDPIDGTRGFLSGKPDWCVSIAVVEDGEPVAGVLSVPVRKQLWSAARGGGAHLNGGRLRPAEGAAGRAPIEVSMPDSIAHAALDRCRDKIRRAPGGPSLALRLARVAAGELGGVLVRPRSNEWDLAAADLMLRETGYCLVDETGERVTYNRPDPSCGFLIAGRPDDLPLLKRCFPESAAGDRH